MKTVISFGILIIFLTALVGCIPGTSIVYQTFDVTSDYDTGHDTPYALLLDDTSMYIIGSVDVIGTSLQWQIEKRDIADGKLDTIFGTGGAVISGNNKSEAYSIAQDNDSIFIGGYSTGTWGSVWRIEKRLKTTGALVTTFDGDGIVEVAGSMSGEYYIANSIIVDAAHIYIAGEYHDGNTNYDWRVEKRDKTTGALETTTFASGTGVIQGKTGFAFMNKVNSLFLDGTTLYTGGALDDGAGTLNWQIETVNSTSGVISNNWVNEGTNDVVESLIADDTNLFVTGYSNNQWRIDKRDKSNGNLDTGFGTGGIIVSNFSGASRANIIIQDQSSLYVGGFEYITSEDFQWRVEKRDKTTGLPVTVFGASGALQVNHKVGTSGIDILNALAVDETYIYIAGGDRTGAGGSVQWRIQKRVKETGSF